MSLIRNLSLICSLLVAGSVARADDAPSKDDIAKFLAFFNKVADAVIADKADCTKMATDMNAIIDANQASIDAAKKAQASGQKLPQDTVNQMMATAKRMAPALAEKCSKDKGVTDALARFPHGPPAHK